MLQVLAHSNLLHELVLVSVHARELTHVGKRVLKAIGQLESVHVVQSVLDVTIHENLGQPQNFSAQVEGISESRLFSLLGGQSLHRLQVKIVIQMKVVQILTMNQQVQHVVALTADLKANLDPVQSGRLEKLGGLERPEEVSLLLRLRWPVMQRIQDVVLEQLLVAHADFDRLARWTMLTVPRFHQRHVKSSTHSAGPHVKRPRGPQKGNAISSIICVKRTLLKEGLHHFAKLEILLVFVRQ